MTDLEPIEPQTAVEMYLSERESEVADKTYQNISQHLGKFLEWCETEEITDITSLSGRKLHEYRIWRETDVSKLTLRVNLSSLRTFIRWCESIDAVETDTYDKILLPTVGDSSRNELLEADTAEQSLQHLRRYQFASREHTILKILWHTGMRRGSLLSVDVGDFHPQKGTLETHHRPQTDTPLKNGRKGQRVIALSDDTVDVISSYIDVHRIDKTDEYGREPLLTTRFGRISGDALKTAVYRITRPCMWGSCPHNRNEADCIAATDDRQASKCPTSVSPHPVRRGSITHHLLNDVPETAVSDRCNVSKKVLEQHYDERTEYEKAESRRKFITDI
jgi:site-specific recombinase XerD